MNDCKDCEQYCSDNTCCTCRNREWYRLYNDYKAKEQECEELKKIIVEARESKLDLKSFLVGEAIQSEYEQQLDQLKAENEHLAEKEKEVRHYLKEAYKYRQTLVEIKEIAQYDVYTSRTDLCLKLNWIKKKIRECEVEDMVTHNKKGGKWN